MHTREQVEQFVWDYIDGLSTADEKAMVERLLQTDSRWRSVYEELLRVRSEIREADLLDQPSMRFTRNVMDEVSKYAIAPPAQSYINKKIIYGIAAFFILSIVGLLGYGISQMDLGSGSGSGTGMGIDFSKWTLDSSSILNSSVIYGFMFLNVVGGLALLDTYLKRDIRKKVEG